MNYIKHLNLIFERIALDDRLNTYHISLYLVLFQEWNSHRFANKIFIFRAEMMRNSKIRSKTTYLRCLRNLDSWGYIRYFPSKDSHKGSMVQIIKPTKVVIPEVAAAPDDTEKDFHSSSKGIKCSCNCHREVQITQKSRTTDGQNLMLPTSTEDRETKLCRSGEDQEKVLPSSREEHEMKLDRSREDQEKILPRSREDQKMVQARTKEDHEMVPLLNIIKHKQIKYNIPESEKEVTDFFQSQKWLPLDGRKFYHHYNSIGWKKGGVIEMTDWKSAATMWVLRANEIKPARYAIPRYPQRDNLKVTKVKDYDKPL